MFIYSLYSFIYVNINTSISPSSLTSSLTLLLKIKCINFTKYNQLNNQKLYN